MRLAKFGWNQNSNKDKIAGYAIVFLAIATVAAIAITKEPSLGDAIIFLVSTYFAMKIFYKRKTLSKID